MDTPLERLCYQRVSLNNLADSPRDNVKGIEPEIEQIAQEYEFFHTRIICKVVEHCPYVFRVWGKKPTVTPPLLMWTSLVTIVFLGDAMVFLLFVGRSRRALVRVLHPLGNWGSILLELSFDN
jgi:hypothetical protein